MRCTGMILAWALLFLSLGAAAAAQGATLENFEGRSLIVFVPSHLAAPSTRALVVVLHGGLGNAQRIESGQSEHGLNMDAEAEKGGFVVAYLNGTAASRRLASDMLAWNAGGGCCGQPAANNVDDVRYIVDTVEHLIARFDIDRGRVFGIGHSNGGMMTQRVMCETGLYAAAVSIAGPLNLDDGNCSAARGRRILDIHGEDDANVPIRGGQGSKGVSDAIYMSEEHTRQNFVKAGASFELLVVAGADHKLDNLNLAIGKTEGQSIAEKAAKFFGLRGKPG